MSERTIRLVREGFPERMALDTAVSRVALAQAAAPLGLETLRLSVPGRAVAFGKHDGVSAGFDQAVVAARTAGFQAFIRLAGGRAAVFHEQSVAMSWTMPAEHPIEGIRTRFAAVAGVLTDAMVSLGIPAEIGALPGEYCPGDYSIHVGPVKVAGLGQRLARSAAHVGGVIVVGNGAAVGEVLVPVYGALDLDWDPGTAGALTDTIPGIEPETVIDAIVAKIEMVATIERVPLAAETVAEATALAHDFEPG
ncbi:MAG: hypothetical protein BMS9Abin07_1437 [Acidimicrobiia bacterium]|nr:MAG: hypothetical protein BMS9Abin07_1437 [Acidimicrobiia bacterium]